MEQARQARTAALTRFVVFADDLTGAGDSVAALLHGGEEGTILARMPPDPAQLPTRVSCVDLDTRGGSVDVAIQAHRRCGQALARVPGPICIFKKIDSTLRGHIGPELQGLFQGIAAGSQERRAPLCLVAPAFPGQGRTLRDGIMHAHGKPAGTMPLMAQLDRVGMRCAHLPVRDLRTDGVSHLVRKLERMREFDGIQGVVCDAETSADLEKIAWAGSILTGRVIWVGSAGLAQALGRMPGRTDVPPAAAPAGWPAAHGSTVFLIGSHAEVARAQIHHLRRSSDLQVITPTPGELTPGVAPSVRHCVEQALADGQDVLVHIDESAPIDAAVSRTLATGLAGALAGMYARVSALITCGGDISRAVFEHLSVGYLVVRASAWPGVTLARCAAYPSLTWILKAGAFGDEALLTRLRSELRSDS